MAYTVIAVSNETRPWTSQKGGPMVSYRVHLKDTAGQVSENVELSQKTATPAPQPGQLLEGNIDNGEYGLKFKKAFQQQNGPRGRSPQESAAITRQHSQDMALRAIDLGVSLGVVKKPEDGKALLDLVAGTADWFDKDVQRVRDATP